MKWTNQLRNNANNNSTGYCARYVSNSLEAGGLNIGRGHAKDMPNNLINAGFAQLPLNTTPEKGDIVVLNPVGKHSYGHIAMWNGNQWVSDFKQKGINVWSDIPINSLSGNIYRS